MLFLRATVPAPAAPPAAALAFLFQLTAGGVSDRHTTPSIVGVVSEAAAAVVYVSGTVPEYLYIAVSVSQSVSIYV